MTYAQGRVVHDADSHVMETREWLEAFLAAEQAELGRGVLGKERGRLDALIDEARKRKADPELEAQAAANPIAGVKGWGAYGAFDPAERTKVLDNFGFSRQLVFPTAGLRPVHESKTPEEKYAAARAYNRAIAAFCADDPRLVAVGFVPLDEPERVLAEAQYALEIGCGAILVSSGPAGERSPGHPVFDPFWALLSERNVPFMLHIGSGTQTQPKAFRNNGRPPHPICTVAARTCASATTSCSGTRRRSS